jgi:predicted  nucleic acid-binding Zn-ribbon protein
MTEAEKSANNWAGSLNKVRNSWSELVNQFINSDNAVSVLQSADKIIQNLSDSATTGSLKVLSDSVASLIKLISELTDKFGTLPTLLAGVMAFKGESLFGSNINQIATDFKGISVEIDKYNHSVDRANYSQKLFKKELENTNVDLRGYLSGLNGAQASVKGYVSSLVTARLKTIALNVATATLNATITFGLSLAISAIVKAFDNWVHAEEKAIESAKELRESGHDTIMELTKESESFDELQKLYIQLYSSTKDINEIKSELSKIQDELIDKYGKEANGIDLVNGNLSEQLENMRKLKREQSEAFIFDTENKKRYEQAKKSLEGTNENARIADSDVTQFFRTTVSTNSTKELSNLLRAFSESGVRYDKIVTDMWGKEASIAVMGDLKSQVEGWQKFADIYKQIDGYNKDVYDNLMHQYVLAKEKYDIDKADVDEFERQTKYYNSFDIPQNVLDNYNNLINKAEELKSIILGDYTDAEKLSAKLELEDVHKELNNISKDYVVLKDDVDVVFNAINTGSQSSVKSIGDLRSEWFESLEDIQKNTISNIDKMDKALKTVVSGNNLSSSDFWELAKLDTDNIIRSISLVNGEYKLSQQELVSLKDQYIQKQIESLKVTQAQIKADEEEARQALIVAKKKLTDNSLFDTVKRGSANLNNPAYRAYLDEVNADIEKAENNVKELGDEWTRNNILIRELNSRLGFSVEQTKALAETYKKNFTDAIDKQINKVNDRKQALEDEKAVLNEQLEVLEEQQKALEETIEQYKTVSNVIKKAIDEETDALKEQQKAEEDAVQARIDALKKSREAKEEEAELAEKQLAVQEKLRDLEKARNNKVRTYSSDRGWHYEADKEAVANAETAYSDARKAYDEFIEKRSYESQLKALESEKDLISKNYEGMIQAYEDYYTEYEKILNEQTDAENEQLANQILGADWRERIKSRDTDTLNKFKANFNSYNSQLKNLVNGEIATLKNSIKAKDEQIKALDKEIDAWNRYKNNLKNSIDEIDSKYEDMQNGLDGLEYSNNLSLSNIESRMWDFKENYKAYMDEAISKARELRDASSEGIDTSAIDSLAERIEKIKGEVNDAIDAMSEKSIFLGGRASATKTHASLITPQFYDLATAPVISNAINKPNVNETNRVININELTIKADNPKQFHDQFEKEMGQYWKIKLTENYVK